VGTSIWTFDRRHVGVKLPGAVARKMQGGCLCLELAHDLANNVRVEVTDRDSLVGSRATDLDSGADGITLDVDHGDRRKMLGCLIGRLGGIALSPRYRRGSAGS
jgi:hypothetical protein